MTLASSRQGTASVDTLEEEKLTREKVLKQIRILMENFKHKAGGILID